MKKTGKSDVIVLIILAILILAALCYLIYLNMGSKESSNLNQGTSGSEAINNSQNTTTNQNLNTNNNVKENSSNVKEEEKKELDGSSNIVSEMIEFVKQPDYVDTSYITDGREVPFFNYYFLDLKNTITKDSFNNEMKQNTVYWYVRRNNIKTGKDYIGGGYDTIKGNDSMVQIMSKSDMDKYMKVIFGNTAYTPSNFKFCNHDLVYDEDTEAYYIEVLYLGIGGGATKPHAVIKYDKGYEYSDRYELYIKSIYVDYDGEGPYDIVYYVKDGSKKVYKSAAYPATEDWEANNVIENEIDNAYTFKITFAKDGNSYYFVKSEVVK